MLIIAVILVSMLVLIEVLTFCFWKLHSFIRKKSRGENVRFKRFFTISIIIYLLSSAPILYGYFFGRWKYEIVNWDYHNKLIPKSFEGYRAVHISDLHLEGFDDNPAFLDTIVNAINNLQPDVIFFTGDIVSYSSKGLVTHLQSLKKLKAKDGIISILGNHDYGIYERDLEKKEQEEDRGKVIELEKNELHWKVLLNEQTILHRGNDSIAILGCENQACGPRPKVRRGDLVKTMRGNKNMFRILLTHDPSHWDAEVRNKTDIPLTLSGHTHAMQCKVFGWTPCRFFYNKSDGAYTDGKQTLYVNIGLGELIPFRIGATPEITLITFFVE